VASIGDQSWAFDVRYCFGLKLHLVLPHVFTACLGGDNELPFCANTSNFWFFAAYPSESCGSAANRESFYAC
jgi:hypothetical protein